MDTIILRELATQYGEAQAADLQQLVENLTRIKDDILSMDKEVRFENAFKALSDVHCVA